MTEEFPSVAEKLPDGWETWSTEAKRAWMAGAMTQREILVFAVEELALPVEVEKHGTMTSRDLAKVVVEASEIFDGGDADNVSM